MGQIHYLHLITPQQQKKIYQFTLTDFYKCLQQVLHQLLFKTIQSQDQTSILQLHRYLTTVVLLWQITQQTHNST